MVAGRWAERWGTTKWTRPPVRGPTRLRRLWEAFSKDLVPGNRHEPGLGGIGEPRAGTSLEGHPNGRRRQTPAHSSADASIRRPRARILSSRQVLVPMPANLSWV